MWKQWLTLFFWVPKSLWMVIAAMKLRHLLLGIKAMTTLDRILKGRDIILPTKVHLVKAMIFQYFLSAQFNSVAQPCPTLCDPMNCSTQGFPVIHQLLEFTQTHVHWVSHAIQPSHRLSSPSPPALNLSQHQGFFKWVSSLHQAARVSEFQLQHQYFQWIFKTVRPPSP